MMPWDIPGISLGPRPKPTPARIASSMILDAICAGVVWVWDRDYPRICNGIPDNPDNVMGVSHKDNHLQLSSLLPQSKVQRLCPFMVITVMPTPTAAVPTLCFCVETWFQGHSHLQSLVACSMQYGGGRPGISVIVCGDVRQTDGVHTWGSLNDLVLRFALVQIFVQLQWSQVGVKFLDS